MTDLERFLTEFMAKDHDSMAQDDDKWITIHPNGTDNRAVMIDDKTGVIKKGLAIGLIGTKLKDIRDNFKDKAKIEQHKARAEGEKAPEPVKENREEKFKNLSDNAQRIWKKIDKFSFEYLKKNSHDDFIEDLNDTFEKYPELLEKLKEGVVEEFDKDNIVNHLSETADKYISEKVKEFAKNDPVAQEFVKSSKDIMNEYVPKAKEFFKDVDLTKGEDITKEQAEKASALLKEYSDKLDANTEKFKGKLFDQDNLFSGSYYDKEMDDLNEQMLRLRRVYDVYYKAQRAKKDADNIFKKISPAGKFFGEKGMRKVSNKYFSINHNPDKDTVILDNVNDRLRVTGRGDLVFLTDKNKGIYVNEKNSLPILTYNEDDNTHSVHMAVKFNRKYAKEYQFKNDFDGTDDLKPVNGFEGLQEIAREKDKNILNTPSYRNMDSKEVPHYRTEFLDNLSSIQQMARKASVKTVTTGGTAGEIENFISQGWNGKVYRYRNGDNAIFVNNQKILLTKEQLDYIDSKDKK